eukprot:1490998-Rhodomonas_salina.1
MVQTKTQLAAHTGGSASEIALRFGAITLHDEAKSLSAYGISGGDSLALTPTCARPNPSSEPWMKSERSAAGADVTCCYQEGREGGRGGGGR